MKGENTLKKISFLSTSRDGMRVVIQVLCHSSVLVSYILSEMQVTGNLIPIGNHTVDDCHKYQRPCL